MHNDDGDDNLDIDNHNIDYHDHPDHPDDM